MGLLSCAEQQYAEAEQEFARSWEADPPLRGRVQPAADPSGAGPGRGLCGPAAEGAAAGTEPGGTAVPRPAGALLHNSLPGRESCRRRANGQGANGDVSVTWPCPGMSRVEEQRLLQLLRGLRSSTPLTR